MTLRVDVANLTKESNNGDNHIEQIQRFDFA